MKKHIYTFIRAVFRLIECFLCIPNFPNLFFYIKLIMSLYTIFVGCGCSSTTYGNLRITNFNKTFLTKGSLILISSFAQFSIVFNFFPIVHYNISLSIFHFSSLHFILLLKLKASEGSLIISSKTLSLYANWNSLGMQKFSSLLIKNLRYLCLLTHSQE